MVAAEPAEDFRRAPIPAQAHDLGQWFRCCCELFSGLPLWAQELRRGRSGSKAKIF
ncbi:hypothetical protein HMPREF9621_01110 [Cutibacterium modestum HL037PA2]|nr:hypothetical protein HMPREF9621_01110 [Cutibacterium modestum HL037PA2]